AVYVESDRTGFAHDAVGGAGGGAEDSVRDGSAQEPGRGARGHGVLPGHGPRDYQLRMAERRLEALGEPVRRGDDGIGVRGYVADGVSSFGYVVAGSDAVAERIPPRARCAPI